MSAQACARLRVGNLELAVPASAIGRALAAVPGRTVPRRAGALCEVMPTAAGLVPVVDLARWLDCGTDRTAGRRVLLLREGSSRVGIKVDDLRGVARTCAVTRLHQDEHPEELCQSAVQWADRSPCTPLLEVSRLMALTRLWAEQADLGDAGAAHESGLAQTGTALAPAVPQPHALLLGGGQRWAVAARHLVQALPATPPEFPLPAGNLVRGIMTWQGRMLPVLDLAAWGFSRGFGGAASGSRPSEFTPAGDVIAVVAHGELRLALRVEGVERVAKLPVAAVSGQPPQHLLMPGLGDVTVLDVEYLFRQLPEVEISRPRGGTQAPVSRMDPVARKQSRPAAPLHLLFEADATYAAEVGDLLKVLPLPVPVQDRLETDDVAVLPYQGQTIPIVALPAISGNVPSSRPEFALVLQLPGGRRAAVAVQRLLGWLGGRSLEPSGMRSAANGTVPMVTLSREGRRRSHILINLSEVAQALT